MNFNISRADGIPFVSGEDGLAPYSSSSPVRVDILVQRQWVLLKPNKKNGLPLIEAARNSVTTSLLDCNNGFLLIHPVSHGIVFVLWVIEFIQVLLNSG